MKLTTGRYFCEGCAHRFADSGTCRNCPDEPLLDLADPEVRRMLQGFDEARVRRR